MFCSFPHFILCGVIIAVSIIMIILSYVLYKSGKDFQSSLFANVFAGLLTGLIICLLSGVKQFYIARLQSKKIWLAHIHKMIMDYKSLLVELRKKQFNVYNDCEELFDFIYDIDSHANWINQEILQSQFDKLLSFNPTKYCKQYFNYDAYAFVKDFEDLHYNILEIETNNPTKKEILNYFEGINRIFMSLNANICNSIREIEIRLKIANRSII